MNYARLERDIQRDEGFRSQVYQDVTGVWTIGYGTTRIFGAPVSENTQAMLQPVAREILRAGLYQALLDAQATAPFWPWLDSVRQEVLVNMAYNLGRSGLAGFKKMIQALEFNDYESAAAEMLDSRWAGQVKTRADRLARQMKTGDT